MPSVFESGKRLQRDRCRLAPVSVCCRLRVHRGLPGPQQPSCFVDQTPLSSRPCLSLLACPGAARAHLAPSVFAPALARSAPGFLLVVAILLWRVSLPLHGRKIVILCYMDFFSLPLHRKRCVCPLDQKNDAFAATS